MTALEDGVAFSDAVREAWKLGYTEPDPRDDLSGNDVARKALILARTLGYRAELDDIKLEPLFHDDGRRRRRARVRRKPRRRSTRRIASASNARAQSGKVLRYVAKIAQPRDLASASRPFRRRRRWAHLRGTDNQVAIYSKRYKTNPLVVTGPGAGAEVTAAGVLNDIVAIADGGAAERSAMKATAFAPGSIGNVGPGFDVLGLADRRTSAIA